MYDAPTLRTFDRAGAAIISGIVLLSFVSANDARGAGFFLQEQSAIASGRAFAGGAAAAGDASTIFYNPAGMTELHGIQGEASIYVIAPQAHVVDRGSSVTVGPGPATPAGGAREDQAFNPQAMGSVFLAAPAGDDLWLGLGVTVPFGLRDHYQLNYFGRYDSTKTELQTIDVAPSVAYAITRRFSIGAGVDIQRADAKLQNALPNPFTPGGPNPATDGLLDAAGGDWSLGFNAGILLKPVDDLRLGLSYRSEIDHDLKGRATTQIPGLLASSQGVTGSFSLPDILAIGVAYDVLPSVTVLGQANYYGWRRFKEVRLTFADGTQQIIPQNYRNSVGFSVGAEWRVTESWTLRSGVEWDQTPTPSDNRSTSVPDSDRTWLAFGLSYEFSERIGIDFSYAHDFSNSAPINRTTNFSSLLTTANTRGRTTDSSDVVGLSMRVRY